MTTHTINKLHISQWVPSLHQVLQTFLWPNGEEKSIHQAPPKQLKMCKQYIDDVIIVWNGEISTLVDFLNKLNQNDKNITFAWEYDPKHTLFRSNNISDR